MDNFTYCTPTRYTFGRDAELQAGPSLAALGLSKTLICIGMGSVIRSGLLDRVTLSLRQAGISYSILSGIEPNPTDPKVREGIDLCRKSAVDSILAVGGGSVIDTAKAIAAGVPYDGDFWDFWAGKSTISHALPVGVVLTIPAAGSEGSGNSVITRLDTMQKISLRTDFALRPKFALLNPQLTFTLPPEQTAAGIADMMAHILERYFSPTRNVDITDRVAEGILMAIIDQAPLVMTNPSDYQARANIMWSGTLAHNGICGTGRREDWVSHFMEHEISALYGVTHGTGLAVILPAFMTFVARHRPAKIAQFSRRVFAITEPDNHRAATLGIHALKQFFSSIGLPVSFSQLGIPTPDIDTLVSRLHANKGRVIGGYLPLTDVDTRIIYNLAL